MSSPSEFILYQTEDGRTRIQCRFENDTLWLTQAQMAELFQTTPQNITTHLKAIFAERELEEFARREGFTAKSLQLIFSERVAMHLTDTGFDPVYGARPLQRALEREVAAPLAAWLLKRPKLQDATLRIDFDGELKVVVSQQ